MSAQLWPPPTMYPVPNPADGDDDDIIIVQGGAYVLSPNNAGDPSFVGVDAPPASPNSEDEEFETTDGFAWVNQGTAVASYANHQLMIEAPTSAGQNLRIRKKSITNPGSDYTYRVKVWLSNVNESFKYGGIVLRESSTSKIVFLAVVQASSTAVNIDCYRYTNETTFSGTTIASRVIGDTYSESMQPWILQVARVSGNLVYSILPPGGGNPIQLASEAVTASFTTEPNEWGVCCNNVNNSTKAYAVFPWARRVA